MSKSRGRNSLNALLVHTDNERLVICVKPI
jgi:hypothetical protein